MLTEAELNLDALALCGITMVVTKLITIIISVTVLISNSYSLEADTWMKSISTHFKHPTDPNEWGKNQTPSEQALLRKYRPHIYISPNGQKPIDFYKDYLPITTLEGATASRTILKQWTENSAYLNYTGPSEIKNASPTAYGRVYNTQLEKMPITVLKYTFVFLNSGLPKELPAPIAFLAKISGNPDRWHILDIHGAIYIVLDQKNQKPLAIMLAQHNHHRTYAVGADVAWPSDNRIKIGFSERSNEPYLLPKGDQIERHRTIPFPDSKAIRFLITGEKAPFMHGYDTVYPIAKGAKKVKYKMAYLPQFDPLYTAQISLGNKYPILFLFPHFSRNGPPGIDFASHPKLADLGKRIPFWYFKEGDPKTADIMSRSFGKNFEVDIDPILNHNGKRLQQALQRLKTRKPG